MSDFQFYKSKEVYREKYYQLPRIFFTSDKYKSMSNDAKIAYTLLKERFEYSIENNWIDDEDNIYFIFTVSELMNLLNCREGKVSSIKKELEKKALLFQKRGGCKYVNGKKVNLPNFLYLGKPEVTAQDVFKINDSGIAKNAIPEKASNSNNLIGIAKNAIPEKASNSTNSNGIAKNADNLLDSKKSLDTNRLKIDSSKTSQQDKILLENFVAISKDTSSWVPENILILIQTFSSDYQSAKETLHTVQKAKHRAEKESGIKIQYEEIGHFTENADFELYTTILKAYQKKSTGEVKNIQNVIFTYVKNWFIEKPIFIKEQFEKNDQLPNTSLDNWLDS